MNTGARTKMMGRLSRVLGLICLFLGLASAARLLGANGSPVGPVQALGVMGFVYLSVFTLGQLFAAVGMWIQSSWGAVVLIGVTLTEMGLALSGNPNVSISMIGFIVRIVLLIGSAIILTFVQWRLIETIQD